jgi:hypothetical protein
MPSFQFTGLGLESFATSLWGFEARNWGFFPAWRFGPTEIA